MSQCTNCSSTDADPMWGLCYECFCLMQSPEPEPTDADYCAGYGHSEFEHSGRCYCGVREYPKANGEGSKR